MLFLLISLYADIYYLYCAILMDILTLLQFGIKAFEETNCSLSTQ